MDSGDKATNPASMAQFLCITIDIHKINVEKGVREEVTNYLHHVLKICSESLPQKQ